MVTHKINKQKKVSMKTLKISTVALSTVLALTSMVTVAKAGFIPIDGNGNGHWENTNDVDLAYTYSAAYYGINNNGLNNGELTSLGCLGLVDESKIAGLADFWWAALDPSGGSYIETSRLETRGSFVITGGIKELQFGCTTNYIGGFGYEPSLFLGDNYSAASTGFSVGQGMAPSAPPANGLLVQGAVQTDSGLIHSDGGGNLSAQSFITLSDRTRKENIKPLPQGQSLEMARALPDFSWNFKGQSQTEGKTDATAETVAENHTQFGPMAQDWHAVTGLDDGRHISLTAMQGLLLGAVKDLATQLPAHGTVAHSTDSTDGCGAGVIKWDNDYIYVSTGTNQWRRAALATW
jgi:hypothetical protein